MRVISGVSRGRKLKAVPGSHTRPTTDKVKEAIFSRIGPYFSGGIVLDLFAGTGALGIEAISRGMDRGVFIDINPKSIEVIKENINAVSQTNQAEIYRNDAKRALKVCAKRELKFDLVFLDPPYKLEVTEEILQHMDSLSLFEKEAIVVVEHDAVHTYNENIGKLQSARRVVYGDTAVTFYDYVSE
ncbi:16S rRNA (guanine(966)-N(2))-methyltransferase RsmD [Chengkuizengella sp. 2205SS18-9]|uniref:16S rRNA (Guanine(966)-N(2))-methyltransferase RsmD n=1 Tax=Chengkuizengella axinellae TaxID=3064388 RepID=A0ABT9IVK2_9BACL|nr:16S rRNA (guanine(966)-N(2))-methyltransferase RsmD [Chengkuizengella sp. 2205SS18-9]MDP5273394.1 16S rRNA (guanine(966)-N(2))-methyltransferase RsmD [Chengkuizengella sp. 2205SS18-9]